MKNICYPQVTQTPLLTLLLRKPSFGFVRPNSATCILANKDGLFVSCCELARNANPDSNPVAPTKPDGVSDGNWIQTDPKKGWNTILRLYSPLEPFFTRKWRPSEIEAVK
jgi:hypothetical protein